MYPSKKEPVSAFTMIFALALIVLILFAIILIIDKFSQQQFNSLPPTTNNNIALATSVQQATPIPPTPIPPTPTVDPYPHFTDGMYIIGEDIQPGTYRTRLAPKGCYFERLSGFSGSLEEILSNESTVYPAIVTILDTDVGFSSSGCGTWTKDLSAITQIKTSFNDGMYIIGCLLYTSPSPRD